jgi:hypothetical protein
MKIYVRKPDMITAQKVDFTSWDAICALYEFMGGEEYIIKHEPADKFPVLIYNGITYEQGDYIIRDSYGFKYKSPSKIFKKTWEEVNETTN